MARAQITTRDGIVVQITGTAEEIIAVVRRLRGDVGGGRKLHGTSRARGKAAPVRLVDLVDSLIDGGFFGKPKDLAAVKSALSELGHHYPVTTLSGAMLRQVRRRSLRRIRQDKRWFYTR